MPCQQAPRVSQRGNIETRVMLIDEQSQWGDTEKKEKRFKIAIFLIYI